MQSFSRLMKAPVVALWHLVLPPTCLACQAVMHGDGHLSLCPACWAHMPRFYIEQQPACQLMLNDAPFTSFEAPFLYDGLTPTLVKNLKYRDQHAGVPFMAQAMVPYLPREADVLVPVPMPRRRLLQRKYNQACLLARALSRQVGTPWQWDGLTRKGKAGRQVGKTAAERRKQLKNAFVADPRLAGKHVVLIDDVLTTGSTAAACTQALLRVGVRQVDVRTFAYVPPDSQ